jgi:hypothetical protein
MARQLWRGGAPSTMSLQSSQLQELQEKIVPASVFSADFSVEPALDSTGSTLVVRYTGKRLIKQIIGGGGPTCKWDEMDEKYLREINEQRLGHDVEDIWDILCQIAFENIQLIRQENQQATVPGLYTRFAGNSESRTFFLGHFGFWRFGMNFTGVHAMECPTIRFLCKQFPGFLNYAFHDVVFRQIDSNSTSRI